MKATECGGVTLTCGFCGVASPLDDFCETPINGRLPKNVYQCPRCKRAIEKRFGPPTVYKSGFVMPGDVTLVEIASVL